MKYTRNEFLKLSGVAAVAATGNLAEFAPRKNEKFTLGLASYTFRKFSLDDTIKMAKQVELRNISLKSMHMPLDRPADEIRKTAEKIRAAGLNLYSVGVIYMKTTADVENAFAYAANAGVGMIIGVPNHELLPQAEELVKKYNIKLAIHNHGPGDILYASPADVYERIKALDKRIGLCMDIGHVKRIALDPAVLLERYKDRLYDMHMKDVDKDTGEGEPVEVGRGIIDIPRVIRTLKKINYQGIISFEHEKDGDAPLAGLAESVGYVRGVTKTV